MQACKKSSFLSFLLIFLLILAPSLECKPPSLTPKDTKTKIDEILKAHVSYQKLTPEIVKRSFQNYLEELDPGKTYLLESEIAAWDHPSDTLLLQTLERIKREDYSSFEELHDVMIRAITRRNDLEINLETAEAPKKSTCGSSKISSGPLLPKSCPAAS